MKVAPLGAPQPQTQQTTNNTDARQKAISAFMGANKAPETPVQHAAHPSQINQSQVSPEDFSAVKAKMGQSDQTEATSQIEETIEEVETPASVAPRIDEEAQKQFEMLKRQERQLRFKQQQREQQIKAREDALVAQEQALKAKDQEYSSGYIKQDRIKQDALSVLAELGISYDDIANQLLNQPPKNPQVDAQFNALKAEIQALKDLQEQSKKQQIEQQDEAYKAAVNQIRMDVKNLVKQSDDYELIRAANATNDVVQLIEETYRKDGLLLSVEEASAEVEKYLEEEAMKFTQLGKIKKKLETSNNASKQAQTQPKVEQQQQPMKTLTNQTSSVRKLSAKERAMLAFKGELK